MTDPFAAALDTLYAHSGVDVTLPLAPPGGTTLSVRALVETFDPANPPLGTEINTWRAGEDRSVFSFRRSEISTVEVGMLLEAPDVAAGTVYTWKVESVVRKDPLELRVLARQVR